VVAYVIFAGQAAAYNQEGGRPPKSFGVYFIISQLLETVSYL